jgi:hypothetical protein
VLGECVRGGPLGWHLDPDRGRSILGDERRIGQPTQVDEPDSAGEAIGRRLGRGDREARLPDAARTDQCEHPLALEEPAHIVQLLLSAEEAVQLRWKLPRARRLRVRGFVAIPARIGARRPVAEILQAEFV